MEKRKRIILVIAALCVIAIALAAFLLLKDTHRFDYQMEGHWVTSDGVVQEKALFNISGKVKEMHDEPYERVYMNYYFPGGGRFSCPSSDTGAPSTTGEVCGAEYYGGMALSYDSDSQWMIPMYYAIDLEKELVIFQWDDGSGRYFVASTDPEVTPESIMDHFETFIERYQFE